MVGSFIALIISVILMFIFEELNAKFSFIENIMPYSLYVVIGLAIVFAVFVLLELIKKITKVIKGR